MYNVQVRTNTGGTFEERLVGHTLDTGYHVRGYNSMQININRMDSCLSLRVKPFHQSS